ncbi:MAG: hypothetical protein ACK5LC_07940 [Coprobacillaceae bacterium]
MKNNFIIGQKTSTFVIYSYLFMAIIFGLLFVFIGYLSNIDIVWLIVIFLVSSIFLLLLSSLFITNDYWFIKNRKMYFFPKYQPYRRLVMNIFNKNENNLMIVIPLSSIIEAHVTWSKKSCPPHGELMFPMFLSISTKDGYTKRLHLDLNTNINEAGKILQYIQTQILDFSDTYDVTSYLLEPDKPLYDYVLSIQNQFN